MSSSANILPFSDGSRWPASLALRFTQRPGGCRLTHSQHEGPLYVQRPFYPEGRDLAHVYLLHPPGGLVSGDDLRISLTLDERARVLATTPGAGRLYRARKDRQWQRQCNQLNVGEGASLEWLPQETIVYPNARGRMETTVDLHCHSVFIGWEISCLGLPACGQDFGEGELRQRFVVNRDGRPLLVEYLSLTDDSRALYQAMAGMQSQAVSGIMVATVKGNEQQVADLLPTLRETLASEAERGMAAVTLIGDLLVARYLGSCSEDCRGAFTALWRLLRPVVLLREASNPGIWST